MPFAIHRGKNMDLVKIGALLSYGIVRGLPFIITAYYVLSTKRTENTGLSLWGVFNKIVLCAVGLGINAATFLGMHYNNYGDFEIIGYIKNVWGLNFYYHDIEYFVVSGTTAVLISVLAGFSLRIFLNTDRFWSVTKGQQYMAMAGGFTVFAIMIAGFGIEEYYRSNIHINEICSNNDSYILDGNALIEDYVELYNSGVLPCKIDGLYLSDNVHELHKMSLDGEIILAGEVVVVPCIENVNSFAINNAGEEVIYLSDADGNILEQVEVGELGNNTSLARIGENIWEVRKCSPGIDNELAMEEKQIPQPVLSHASGFYDEAFELEITCSEDAAIYYTLDGSVPDEGSYLYEESIYVYDKSAEPNVWRSIQNVVPEWKEYTPDETPVDKAFLVRAVAVDYYGNKSKETVATYFIDKEQYKKETVISLISDPYGLFSDEMGICVTGKWYDEWYLNGQEGSEPTPNFKIGDAERDAIIEVFNASESVLKQDVGIRLQGASSREHEDKRFSVYAREEYSGSEVFDIILFGRETPAHSLLIRDNFADLMCQSLMESRDIPTQRGEPVYLFLDGERWYSNRFLREKYSTQYFEDNYGISKDNLILIKSGSVSKGVETDRVLYDALYSYIEENDFSDTDVYEEFCQKVDVSNYIDFLCANIYCANMDVDDTKNVVMWRSREVRDDKYSDGKWRWVLYDMDAVEWTSIRYYEAPEVAGVDSFSKKPRYAGCAYNQGIIYSALRQNEDFCKQFVLTFMDLLNTNFSVESAEILLQKYGRDITWLESFFERRPVYMKEYLAKEFELTGSVETVTIVNENTECGSVSVNSITPEIKDGSWSGEYFTDYPVTITAEPVEGYEFVGWSGSVVSEELTIEVPVEQGGIVLKAEFQQIN